MGAHSIPDVKFLPAKGNFGRIPVRIKKQNFRIRLFWHNEVQKEINKSTGRADKGWNWVLKYIPLSVAVKTSASAEAYVYEGLSNHGKYSRKWLPIAMLAIRMPVPALHNNKLDSVYLWFLSTAPETILTKWFGNAQPGLVGQASVEKTISFSFHFGFGGRCGLHASPKGTGLKKFYGDSCGLIPLPTNVAIPDMLLPPSKRGLPSNQSNDGRYFYADEIVAQKTYSKFNAYR